MVAVDNILTFMNNSIGVLVDSKFADDVITVDGVDNMDTVLTNAVIGDFVMNRDANAVLLVVNVIVSFVVANGAVAFVVAFNSDDVVDADIFGDGVVFIAPDNVLGTVVVDELDIILPLVNLEAAMVVVVVLVTITGAKVQWD